MTAKVLAATMFGTIDSNALVPIIALYAPSVSADLVQTGVIVGLFSLVDAPANVSEPRDRRGRLAIRKARPHGQPNDLRGKITGPIIRVLFNGMATCRGRH